MHIFSICCCLEQSDRRTDIKHDTAETLGSMSLIVTSRGRKELNSIHWQWHWAKCFSFIVFYICLSVCRYFKGNIIMPKMCTLSSLRKSPLENYWAKQCHYCPYSLAKSHRFSFLKTQSQLLSAVLGCSQLSTEPADITFLFWISWIYLLNYFLAVHACCKFEKKNHAF